MTTFWLVNFPLPPSVNEYLIPIAGGWATNKKGKKYQKGRWVKSEVHKLFTENCRKYAVLHNNSIERIKCEIHGLVDHARSQNLRIAFRVDTYFAFEDSRLWTVNNFAEQLDADNRVKPCRDAVSELLKLDDKYFFSGFYEKVTVPTKAEECSYVRITLTTPRTLNDLRSQMVKNKNTGVL